MGDWTLKSGDAVHVYSNPQSIMLQLRREVPTEVDMTGTSFKAAVALTSADAVAIAGELLIAAPSQIKTQGEQPRQTTHKQPRLHEAVKIGQPQDLWRILSAPYPHAAMGGGIPLD